jgi:hypothetical protein
VLVLLVVNSRFATNRDLAEMAIYRETFCRQASLSKEERCKEAKSQQNWNSDEGAEFNPWGSDSMGLRSK